MLQDASALAVAGLPVGCGCVLPNQTLQFHHVLELASRKALAHKLSQNRLRRRLAQRPAHFQLLLQPRKAVPLCLRPLNLLALKSLEAIPSASMITLRKPCSTFSTMLPDINAFDNPSSLISD